MYPRIKTDVSIVVSLKRSYLLQHNTQASRKMRLLIKSPIQLCDSSQCNHRGHLLIQYSPALKAMRGSIPAKEHDESPGQMVGYKTIFGGKEIPIRTKEVSWCEDSAGFLF